jgi:CDP-glucose 4,6-dehydratase
MNNIATLRKFWKGKKVFLTGHTGFKGRWFSIFLNLLGAKVAGYSLKPNLNPSLYDLAKLDKEIHKTIFGDIRDYSKLKNSIKKFSPDFIVHMAAQPLVRYSYVKPVETYATNVMGTVHLLEAMRTCSSVRAAVMVTTDKCYENKEQLSGYKETDQMGGFDPYSSSKGCAELVASSFRNSFFNINEYKR